ncbi:hypothetical protein DMUE_3165 [Dictyocoela muelleri]|nr:hypothetical protein DMUE_3165 [Dictyocoela muelleri]
MKLKEYIYMNNHRLIEAEVERLVHAPLTELNDLLSYDETKLFFLVIIEKKIRLAEQNNLPLSTFSSLICNLRFDNELLNNKLAHVCGLLCVLDWPEITFNFMADWFGLLILEKFLFLILYGTEIDSKRQRELIAAFMNFDLEGVYDKLLVYPGIAMGVLKHISVFRTVDYKRIAALGFVGDDFDEIIYNLMDSDRGVLLLLKDRKPTSRIISKLKGNECFEYALSGLNDPSTFEASVYYIKNHPNVLNQPILLLNNLLIMMNNYENQEDYIQNEIKHITSTYTRKFPEIIPHLLKNTKCKSKDLLAIVVRNCINKEKIQSDDKFVMCYVHYSLGEKQECMKYLQGADDKLMANILDKFEFSEKELKMFISGEFAVNDVPELNYLELNNAEIYNLESNKKPRLITFSYPISEEVRVKAQIKLNFGVRFDGNVYRYYYIVKNDILDDVNVFYDYFRASNCYEGVFPVFGLLFKKVTVPDDVLKVIYDNLDTVETRFFKEFVTDCLPTIPHKNFFIQKIHPRVINEWYHDEHMLNIIKKYLDVLNSLDDIDRISDFVLFEHVQILRKALTYLNFKEYSPEKLINNLIQIYQSPVVITLQPMIINLLIQAILKSTSPDLQEIKNNLISQSKNRQKHLINDYMKNLKPKPLNSLFSIPKVTAKRIFKKEKIENNVKDDGEIASFMKEME